MVQTEEHYTDVKIAWGKGNTEIITVGRHQYLSSTMDRTLNKRSTRKQKMSTHNKSTIAKRHV